MDPTLVKKEIMEMSNIQLIMELLSDNYSEEAKDWIKSEFENRNGKIDNIEKSLSEELHNIKNRAERCHFCGAPDVIYRSKDFVYARNQKVSLNLEKSALGLLSAAFVGVGFRIFDISEEYSPPLQLHLCFRCFDQKRYHKVRGNEIISFTGDDFRTHPMFSYYKYLGFHDIRELSE